MMKHSARCGNRTNNDNGYCYLHQDQSPDYEEKKSTDTERLTSVQCKGNAKSTGNRCRNKTKNANGYCHLHRDQVN